VEYEALGQEFSTRSKRIEQQIPLLRALWSQAEVTSHDDFDHVEAAGLCPLPITRPIPIWMGGHADVVLRRVGRLADGWFPMAWPGHGLEEQREKVLAAGVAAGRDMTDFPMEGQLAWGGDLDRAAAFAERWAAAGTTHLSVNTMAAGATSVDDHLRGLAEMADLLGLS
jgi:alkanesulfonate monooxygenase SsuD/methylene tetrahydromethanopterin reductase-like flavin-dependent oxidoreductase (luciferase family)